MPFNRFVATGAMALAIIGPKKPPLCNRVIFLCFLLRFKGWLIFLYLLWNSSIHFLFRGLRDYLLTCFLAILSYLTVNFVFPNLTDLAFTSLFYYIFFTIFLLHQVLAGRKNFVFVFFYVSKVFHIFLQNSSIPFLFLGLVTLSSHVLLLPILLYLTVNSVFPNLTDFGFHSLRLIIYIFLLFLPFLQGVVLVLATC